MGYDRVFRVTASALNLREGPSTGHAPLVRLLTGQAVLRLDTADYQGWWYVFADTPGEGLYIGYVHSDFLRPVQQDGGAGEDVAADVPRELEPEMPGDGAGGGASPEAPAWIDGWNPAVPRSRRHNGNFRKTNDARPVRRVIIHVTGNNDFDSTRKFFTAAGGVIGAHYVIALDGTLHQFVSEERRANHAGMEAHIRKLYLQGGRGWRRYKKYFTRANLPGRNYPPGSVYLDKALNVLPGETGEGVALVMPPGGGEWPEYAYFDARWGPGALPPGFSAASPSPNADSIGIEIVSTGASTPNAERYTDAMYATLGPLVADLCARHGLPVTPETVCGHEDVNPVERWGWDPHQGFDWARLFSLAGAMPQPAV
jgi:hypothetical protein